MEKTFTHNVPVSAYAAAGVCAAAPEARLLVPVVAQLPRVQSAQILPAAGRDQAAKRNYMGPETSPSITLGGFRGVPPRGRPV
jgi:hypothetical protein